MKTCHKCGAQYTDAVSFCQRDGEVLAGDEAQMTGRILDGQYEIEAFIARGGMGAVYRARHTMLGDRVAIKILPPEMRQNAEWLRRFQREGQAARRFHHPNSVMVHDLRTSAEGEVYLVMEYVEGRTLDAELALRGGRLAPAEILRLIEPVASVLDQAHQMNVVHRDLKPSNIMITERGVVKVLDLGLAKLGDLEGADARLTTAGQLLGTPYYMSPEQWGELQRDGRLEVDGRADIYSLGVVVYEMTTGRRPFEAASVIELRHAHCDLAPRSPAEFDASLPRGWADATLRALAKDRNDRQASAGEFVRELRASLGVDAPSFESAARAVAPTIINPPAVTAAGLAHQTPHGLNQPTLRAPAHSNGYSPPPQTYPQTYPQASGSAPFGMSAASQKTGNTRSLFIVGALILIMLGALAAGGYMIWKWKSNGEAKSSTARSETKQPPEESGGSVEENRKTVGADDAFMRYHLLLSSSPLEAQQRATGRDPVKPGQSVQFAITPSESGYLYMTGLDDKGNPVVMPVNVLDPELQVTAGEEVLVPSLPTVKLNDRPGTDAFTIIFTKERLSLPFVTETLPLDGTFRKLTTAERQQIEELRQGSAPVHVEYSEQDGGTALVQPGSEAGAKAVVVDIELKLER
ncbi:MAG TPA: protein kinase [Pyrinomonadaceae bacterium]|jgi:serine/threonine protein kinase